MPAAEAAKTKILIARASESDLADWLPLRQSLWGKESEPQRLLETVGELLKRADRYCVFIARGGAGNAIGFAEVSLRFDYVNGCVTSPVAFLEGVFVTPQARRSGCARLLVEAVTVWAQERGATELASDVDLANTISQDMHQSLGFKETERVVYYKKQV